MTQLIRFVQSTIDRHDKTVQQFAHEIGISEGYLYNILSGRQKAGTKFFKQFSEYTGISIDTLVEMQDASTDDPPVGIEYVHHIPTPEEVEIARQIYLNTPVENRETLRHLARIFGYPDLYEGLDDE